MAPSKPISSTRLRLTLAAGAILVLSAPGCAAESLLEARSLDCATPCSSAGDPALDGDDPRAFCDDHDPCTTDVNCTPCSAVPAAEQDVYHCTADQDVPAFCAGRAGCVHVPLTTPAGTINSCFPVADAAEPHAGSCRAGRCVENEE